MTWSMLRDIAFDTGLIVAVTVGWLIFVNGVLLNALYSFQLVMAWRALRRRRAARTPLSA